MSDVNVTLTNLPINVTVSTPGPPGSPGADGTGSSTAGIGITGVSISGGLGITGALNINAGNNITLTQIGSNTFSISSLTGGGSSDLNGLISTGSADLRYLQTGVSGEFLKGASLVGLISTGSADLRYLQTGVSGEFLKGASLNGLISSGAVASLNYISTGNADLRYLQTGVSGEFLKATNLNGFITSGNVANLNYITTGNADLRYIQTGASGEFLKGASLAGLISTGSADLRYLQTGVSGEFLNAGNLNGLISTGSADLRYLQTGVSGEFLKAASLVGLISTGNVNVISGALKLEIDTTGGYLYGLINASSAGVSSLNSQSGSLTLVGKGNVSVSVEGQNINISGITSDLPFIFEKAYLSSGDTSTGFIPFNYTFSSTPSVVGNLINNSGDQFIAYHISGINTSGFYLNFSNNLLTNNYEYHYYATTGSGYLLMGGGIGEANSHTYSVKTVVDNYTFTSSDDVVVFNKASNVTGYLPVAGGGGKIYMIKNINTGNLLVTGDGLQTIDGEFTQSIDQWSSMSIVDYDTGGWVIV